MKAYIPHCKFCGTELIHGEVCGECLISAEKCPLNRAICGIACPYKKDGFCDFPFLWSSRIRAYPDKVTK